MSSSSLSAADELTQITREVKELRARQTTTAHYTNIQQNGDHQENGDHHPPHPQIPQSPLPFEEPEGHVEVHDQPMRFVLQPDPSPPAGPYSSFSPTSPISFSRSRLGLPHSSSKGIYHLFPSYCIGGKTLHINFS